LDGIFGTHNTYTTLRSAYKAAPTYRHSREDFASFFAGTQIVPPGVAEAKSWIEGLAVAPPPEGPYVLCGTGIKQ
jgi:hypothetical protein